MGAPAQRGRPQLVVPPRRVRRGPWGGRQQEPLDPDPALPSASSLAYALPPQPASPARRRPGPEETLGPQVFHLRDRPVPSMCRARVRESEEELGVKLGIWAEPFM